MMFAAVGLQMAYLQAREELAAANADLAEARQELRRLSSANEDLRRALGDLDVEARALRAEVQALGLKLPEVAP
jgi:uncharacterized protein (DUF3084 family)